MMQKSKNFVSGCVKPNIEITRRLHVDQLDTINGVEGNFLHSIATYLSGRKQVVVV